MDLNREIPLPSEIERKFLVKQEVFEAPDEGLRLEQGYLCTDPERTVRVRRAGEEAWLTIKGRTTGATRAEYEYPIPARDARELLKIAEGPLIEKTRYRVLVGAHTWDVDIFDGENAGLWLAEVELSREDEEFELPEWLAEEVTSDARYYNANLVKNPYLSW